MKAFSETLRKVISMRPVRRTLCVCALFLFADAATAVTVFEGRVSTVEPTYLPAQVAFQMNTGSALCPGGAWLWWRKTDPDNNKTAYATLLAVLLAGKRIRVYLDDGDASCTVHHVHVLEHDIAKYWKCTD